MRRAGRAPWVAWVAFFAAACGGGGAQTEGPATGPEPVLEPVAEEAPDTISEIVVIPKTEEEAPPPPETLPEFPEALPPDTAMQDTAMMEETMAPDTLAPLGPALLPPDTLPTGPEAAMPEPELLPPIEVPPAAPPVVVEPNTVSPGMSEEDVQTALGAPLYTRAYAEHTYYFYDNGREKEAGFLDFVTFRSGRVVDAVFRHPDRRYTGNSSSPRGVTPRPSPGEGSLTVPSPNDYVTPPPQ